MLQGANTEHFNSLFLKAQKANWQIFIFFSLGTNGLIREAR